MFHAPHFHPQLNGNFKHHNCESEPVSADSKLNRGSSTMLFHYFQTLALTFSQLRIKEKDSVLEASCHYLQTSEDTHVYWSVLLQFVFKLWQQNKDSIFSNLKVTYLMCLVKVFRSVFMKDAARINISFYYYLRSYYVASLSQWVLLHLTQKHKVNDKLP